MGDSLQPDSNGTSLEGCETPALSSHSPSAALRQGKGSRHVLRDGSPRFFRTRMGPRAHEIRGRATRPERNPCIPEGWKRASKSEEAP